MLEKGSETVPGMVAHEEVPAPLRGQLADVLRQAREVLGEPLPETRAPVPVDEQLARGWLRQVWDQTTAQLTIGGVDACRVARLVALLGQIRTCEQLLNDQHRHRWSQRQRQVSAALAEMDTAHTIAEISRRAPHAAARIGFDRVLLSRIDGDRWVTESISDGRDERWAQDILDAGRVNPRLLDNSLLETQIVRRRQPLVVAATDQLTNLHPELLAATRSRSYAAAPILSDQTVIGFIHADHYHHGYRATTTDREVLRAFCAGLSRSLNHAVAVEKIQALDALIDGALNTPVALTRTALSPTRLQIGGRQDFASGALDPRQPSSPCTRETLGHGLDIGFGAGARARGASARGPRPHEALTDRENQVLDLLARGLTNGQIGHTLFITEGTVKCHVKQILRKLDAANRAEAVSLWLQPQNLDSAAAHATGG